MNDLSKRTGNARLSMGMGKLKRLIGAMHWVHDCFHCNDDPSAGTLDEAALNDAMTRASVRGSTADQVSTVAKAADPGKFQYERK